MKVLLSIKPEFVEKIFDGTKKFEFRKNAFKKVGITSVVIYATMPVGKVVGEFDITDLITDDPAIIWAMTGNHAGIDKAFFDSYYDNRQRAVAIGIGKVRRYDQPMPLIELGIGSTPPQSYRYL
ncbi:MAG: ASCH domain-containing protein [Aeromonas sp.]